MPNLFDHLFVALVLVVLFPLAGWWSYRRFLVRLARDGDAALVREYRVTLLWLAGLLAATLALWFGAGRGLRALGFNPLDNGGGLAAGLAVGAAIGLAARPLLALYSVRARAGIAAAQRSMEPFLPRTRRQLAWAIAVSLAAGLAEEVAYRGFLMAYLASWFGTVGTIAVSSLIFGLAHLYQGKSGVAMTTLLGVLLGALYVHTNSLLLPILLHAGAQPVVDGHRLDRPARAGREPKRLSLVPALQHNRGRT